MMKSFHVLDGQQLIQTLYTIILRNLVGIS